MFEDIQKVNAKFQATFVKLDDVATAQLKAAYVGVGGQDWPDDATVELGRTPLRPGVIYAYLFGQDGCFQFKFTFPEAAAASIFVSA